MDLVNRVSEWAEHNRFLVLGVILAVIFAIGIVGCQPKTESLVYPGQKVTPAQLDRETILIQQGIDDQAAAIRALESRYNADVASKQLQLKAAQDDLVLQQQKRAELIQYVAGIGTAVAQGGLTAPAAIGSIAQIALLLFAGGMTADSIRKSKVIGTLKSGDAPDLRAS